MNDQQHRSHLSTPHGLEHATGGPVSLKDDTFEAMSSRPGSITAQLERQNACSVAAALNSSLASGGNAKTPPKKPIVGKKKPLEAPVNPLRIHTSLGTPKAQDESGGVSFGRICLIIRLKRCQPRHKLDYASHRS
ncbi:hypothetical protein Tco_0685515 [Tanacetum coccineum]